MKNLFKIEIPEKRNFGLDLLRFIAIFTVLVSHSVTLLPPIFQTSHLFITDGVLIFFVLSGFLIGRILIRDFQDGMNFKIIVRFWKRRWFRTIPAYFFSILLIIILSIIKVYPFEKIEVLKSLFFIQNIFFAPKSFFTESWSLSIEEWFYLTMPILLFFLYIFGKTSIKRNVLIAFFIILIFSFFIRCYYFFNINIDSVTIWDNQFRKPVITRLDSILAGVLAAWFYVFNKEQFYKLRNILFIVGLSFFLAHKIYADYFLTIFGFYQSVVYLFFIPLAVALMIPKIYYIKEASSKFLSKCISIGSLTSYSLYLLNSTIVMGFILHPMILDPYLKFILFWIICILGSILMYKYVELPFMMFRDKKVI